MELDEYDLRDMWRCPECGANEENPEPDCPRCARAIADAERAAEIRDEQREWAMEWADRLPLLPEDLDVMF